MAEIKDMIRLTGVKFTYAGIDWIIVRESKQRAYAASVEVERTFNVEKGRFFKLFKDGTITVNGRVG